MKRRRIFQFIALAAILYLVPLAITKVTYKPGPPFVCTIRRPNKTDAVAVVRGRSIRLYEWHGDKDHPERSSRFDLVSEAVAPFPVRTVGVVQLTSEYPYEDALLVGYVKRTALVRFRNAKAVVRGVELGLHGSLHDAISYEDGSGRVYLVVRTSPLYPFFKSKPSIARYRIEASRDDVKFIAAGEGIPVRERARGLSVADLDGDHNPEMIVTFQKSAYAYAWRRDRLARKWKAPLPGGKDGVPFGIGSYEPGGVAVGTNDGPRMRIRIYACDDGQWRMIGGSPEIQRGSILRILPGSGLPESAIMSIPGPKDTQHIRRCAFDLQSRFLPPRGCQALRADFSICASGPRELGSIPANARLAVGRFSPLVCWVAYSDGDAPVAIPTPVWQYVE